MGETKRKKIEKRKDGESLVSAQKYICCRCGIAYPKPIGYFTVSHSPMYQGSKRLPFCIECADVMFAEYRKILGDERAAMRRMCMKMDVYWSHAIADIVESHPNVNSYIRNYVSKTNMKRFLGKTYDDTLREEEMGDACPSGLQKKESIENSQIIQELEVDPEVIKFWGPGLPPKKYLELEERLQYFKSRYPQEHELSLGEEAILRQLAALEVDNNYDRAAGRPIDKNTSLINTLIGSADLKPVQKKAEDSSAKIENMPLGVGIQKWELERPLPPTPEELIDRNGLVKAIHTWFLGHASKMVGLKNHHSSLYDEAMDELRVKPISYEEEDDDVLLYDLFSDKKAGEEHG